ncbi:MAG: YheC/YheD family protein [Bacillota bacterium]
MNLWQGRILASAQAGRLLDLPPDALRSLRLDGEEVVTLRVGQRRLPVRVRPGQRGTPAVARASRPVLAALALPPGHRFWLRREADGGLHLGPLLGFLSLRSIYANQRACPYAGDQNFFRDACLLAARAGGLAYVFGPGDVNWASLSTRGYTYRLSPSGTGGRWVPGVFPLPDVVYNRILGRSRELSAPIRSVEGRLRSLPLTSAFFNPGYFDKWQVNEALSRDGAVGDLIPRTLRATPRHVLEMLDATGMVYVKPRDGFAGRGIMRVERLGPHRYRVTRLSGVRPIRSLGGWKTVLRLVGANARGTRCIVQEGVRLPEYRGRAFDLRAMVQKDESGTWCMTALVAKLAAPGGITTHIRTGGDAQMVGPVLAHVFGKDAPLVRQRAEEAGLAVAAALERGIGLELGELGMDLAVDRKGRPWVLEVNAKPGRKVFHLMPAWNRTWTRRLVYYGGYRAGFQRDGRFAGALSAAPGSAPAANSPSGAAPEAAVSMALPGGGAR